MNNHISDQMIESFAKGSISNENRETVKLHTLECHECADRLVVASLALRVTERINRLLREEDESTPESLVA